MTLEVIDDGVGGADQSAGSGLLGLADRVAVVDGTFVVDSPPGDGTTVTCRVPVPARGAATDRPRGGQWSPCHDRWVDPDVHDRRHPGLHVVHPDATATRPPAGWPRASPASPVTSWRRTSGALLELRGDEALSVFGSARDAIEAAVGAAGRFVNRAVRDADMPLLVGIGIDVGEAVPVEGGYRGGALNLAARLCSLAAPGRDPGQHHRDPSRRADGRHRPTRLAARPG